MRPRVLLVTREIDDAQRRKLEALGEALDLRVLAFRDGRRGGLLDYGRLPARVARELRASRPDALLVQGAHETAAALVARRLAGSRAKVILDVHGDWRTPSRLYGSPLRRLLSPAADAAATLALRHADAARSITPYTTRLLREAGVEPAAEFPAFMDFDPFAAPPVPIPERPQALFVGVLERYKGIDILLDAWPHVGAGRLRIVGSGTYRAAAARHDWTERLDANGVARALDDAWCLVLPSRSEGMGRVVVEAFCRGRAVVGSRVGGIADLVEDGVNGLLVDPEEPEELAAALRRVLSDRPLAARLGDAARRSAEPFLITPEEFAQRLRDLVERVVH